MIQLKDLCQKASSNIAQKDLEGHEGQYPIYGASGLIGYVDFYKQENPYVAVVKDGAGIGRVMCLPEKSSVIGTMQYILPNEGVNVHYLAFAMEHMNLAKYFSGATIPHIYFKDYGKEKLLERTEKEQKSIAEILSKMDSLISLRKQQIAKLDELVKARFVEMFGEPVSNPYKFEVRSLQNMLDDGIITYHLDGNHGSDYPRNEEFVESGVSYISANCIIDDTVNLNLAKHLTEERAAKLRKGIAQDEDVLFAHNATVGPVAILHTRETKVILGTSLTAYRCNKQRILPAYLKAYMQSEGFVRQYTKDMKQTTRNQVPITAQRKYLFIVPPLSLQNQFAAFVERVDQQKQTVQQSLEKLELMKKALMQEYFG